MDSMVFAEIFSGDGIVDAIVEDDAILEHLHYGSTFMACGGGEHLACSVESDVETAGEEITACAEAELSGDKGILGSAVRA